jgi:hypothetical protein
MPQVRPHRLQGLMTLHPGDIIPPELQVPEAKAAVIRWVLAQPLPGVLKARLLKGWFIHVGLPIDGRALTEVENSGT